MRRHETGHLRRAHLAIPIDDCEGRPWRSYSQLWVCCRAPARSLAPFGVLCGMDRSVDPRSPGLSNGGAPELGRHGACRICPSSSQCVSSWCAWPFPSDQTHRPGPCYAKPCLCSGGGCRSAGTRPRRAAGSGFGPRSSTVRCAQLPHPDHSSSRSCTALLGRPRHGSLGLLGLLTKAPTHTQGG
jgi:hypothetical protein